MSTRQLRLVLVRASLFAIVCVSQMFAQSASLVSITVTPSSASIASGSTQQYIATGLFSDGSSQNVTSTSTWTSSNAAVVSMGSTGMALGLAPGNATIRAAVGAVAGSASAAVSNTNLATWWRFTEGSGATSADSSGNGTPLTLFNAMTWSAGQIGNAVTANGTNQYAASSAVNLSATKAVTWSAWVNRTYGNSAAVLIENSNNFNASTTGFGFFPDDSGDCGLPNTMMTGVNGNVGYTLNCYTQPTSGVWHHLAAIYDKSQTGTKVISLYIDGVLQTPVRQLNTATNTNGFGSNPVYLFPRGGSSNFGAGKIDDVRIYSTVLTAAQIQQIYQQGLGTLTSITVGPANATLNSGTTLQYVATGSYSSGMTLNLTGSATWSSSNTNAATVSAGGLATGVAAGSTVIQAVSGIVAGSTGLTVQTGPTLVSIAVSPTSFTLPAGGTQQLTATGTYSDGSKQNLSSAVAWSSTNSGVATVSSSGLVTAVANGSSTINAVLNGASASAQATVQTIANLSGWWQFSEGSGTTAADSSGNGNTATLFNSVSWVSGQNGSAISANGTNQYAQIPNVNLSTTNAVTWTGWVNRTYGSGVGALIEDSSNFNTSSTGFGFFPDDSADCGVANTMMTGVNGNVGYTLSCYAQPTSGVWHHIAAVYDKSQAGTGVISLYIDGVLQTPVRQLNTSTNTNGFGSNPIYVFSRGGTSNFAAGKLDDLRVYNAALSAAQIQQIYQQGLGTVTSIAVTPASATLNSGSVLQYTAMATYSGGTTLNVTSSVTWKSSNTAAATISAAGLASGVAAGSTTIQAVLGSVTGSTGLTVQAGPSLVSIAVTPSSFTLPPGGTQQLTATGTYSDGSTQNLTGAVGWTSTNTAAATVSASGLVTAVANGNATINAAMNSIAGSSQATVFAIANLAAWWQFNDGSGSTAADSSGYGNTASLFNGISWVAGQSGSAISANGTNQYVLTPAINLSATKAMT